MPWYKIILPSKTVGHGALERAHAVFNKKFLEYRGDREMAVFDSTDEDWSETILYISPKLALVSPAELADFSAQETEVPSGNEPEFCPLICADEDAALALIAA